MPSAHTLLKERRKSSNNNSNRATIAHYIYKKKLHYDVIGLQDVNNCRDGNMLYITITEM